MKLWDGTLGWFNVTQERSRLGVDRATVRHAVYISRILLNLSFVAEFPEGTFGNKGYKNIILQTFMGLNPLLSLVRMMKPVDRTQRKRRVCTSRLAYERLETGIGTPTQGGFIADNGSGWRRTGGILSLLLLLAMLGVWGDFLIGGRAGELIAASGIFGFVVLLALRVGMLLELGKNQQEYRGIDRFGSSLEPRRRR